MRDRLTKQMVKLKGDCEDRVTELQSQLDLAHKCQLPSMFKMKDGVKQYFNLKFDIYLNVLIISTNQI